MNPTPNPRFRILAIAGAVVVAMIIIIVVIGASGVQIGGSKGGLTINTNDPNATITASAKGSSQKLTSGKAAQVASGDYIVTVEDAGNQTAQFVHVTAGQSSRYTINLLTAAAKAEPVADVNALDFTVGPSSLLYIDQQKYQLFQINNQNTLSGPRSQVAFTLDQWAAGSTYGAGIDNAGAAYAISDGNVAQLSPAAGAATTVAVAPDRTISIAYGSKIFQGTPQTGFRQVFDAGRAPSYLLATNGQLALITTGHQGSSGKDDSASVDVINAAGKHVQKSLDLYQAAWSPDGKYLLTTADSGTAIYDSSLNLVQNLPNLNVSNPVWLGNKVVLYNLHDRLWQYDLSEGKARVIAQMPTDHAIANIVPGPDGAYVYLSVQHDPGSNNDLFIERVGLHGQTPSPASAVQAQLPTFTDRCLISLVNFTAPTIQMLGPASVDCQSQAQSWVSSFGLNPASFGYQRTNVPPDEPSGQ
jgi:hypothetical protein